MMNFLIWVEFWYRWVNRGVYIIKEIKWVLISIEEYKGWCFMGIFEFKFYKGVVLVVILRFGFLKMLFYDSYWVLVLKGIVYGYYWIFRVKKVSF